MTFKTIHTAIGLAAIAQAEASGVPINLTHMAVGDGNGNPVSPSEAQTSLAREMFRATVNRVFQDPATPTRFTAELVIPAAVGGFVLREVGIFTAAGALFAVGNLPDTYKPQASEGAYADTVVRMEFLVTNASVVTIQIDPNVAVATQAWIINNVTPCSLFPGGTTGQVLRKKTNGCGDTEWANPTDVNVVVNMVPEHQTLAAGQTTVTLSTVTTNGLAVYIEGVRLREDQWTAVSATQLTLGTSYPAGTKFTGVQNEPAGVLANPLDRDLNLSDVPSKATARANLDVYSKAESDASGQPGDIKYTARATAPTGWLKANGAAISRTAYAALYSVIGTTYGAGDGFNTFNVPDLRGVVIRGLDEGRGLDAGRSLGTYQADDIKSHTHEVPYGPNEGDNTSNVTNGGTTAGNITTLATGGGETRMKNVALVPLIKY